MRYDLVVFPLDVLDMLSTDSGTSEVLQELTDLNREIILLKEIQGLGLEEISAILEVPVGTVKSRSHRARLELAQKLVAVGMGA